MHRAGAGWSGQPYRLVAACLPTWDSLTSQPMLSSRRSRNLAPLKHSSCREGSADTVLQGRQSGSGRSGTRVCEGQKVSTCCSWPAWIRHSSWCAHVKQCNFTHLMRMNARSAFSSSLSSREELSAGTAASEPVRDIRPVPVAAAAAAACCCGSTEATAAATVTAAAIPLGSWIRRRLAAGPPLGLRPSSSPFTAAAAAAATPAARAACTWLPPWWLPSQSCRPNRSASRGTGR